MEILKLTTQNIQDQHICCGFSDKKCAEGYQNKKNWLKTEFKNGYTFQKLDARGKVFIEYVPIAHSWLPIEGKNYLVINCFWVSGQFKGQGYAKQLLRHCIDDAKALGMDGIVAISSEKKRPFMSDPKFFRLQGFEIVDQAPPFFKLYALRINPSAPTPRFLDSARAGTCPDKEGIVVYYSDTCPFNAYYLNQHLVNYARSKNLPLKIHHLKSKEEARSMPVPWIICSVFYRGELVTLEMKPDRHLDKLIGTA